MIFCYKNHKNFLKSLSGRASSPHPREGGPKVNLSNGYLQVVWLFCWLCPRQGSPKPGGHPCPAAGSPETATAEGLRGLCSS